jgi:hypothetical protein
MYSSMFVTIPKSNIIMHPNPKYGIIVTYQMQPFKVKIDVQLLALSKTLVT